MTTPTPPRDDDEIETIDLLGALEASLNRARDHRRTNPVSPDSKAR